MTRPLLFRTSTLTGALTQAALLGTLTLTAFGCQESAKAKGPDQTPPKAADAPASPDAVKAEAKPAEAPAAEQAEAPIYAVKIRPGDAKAGQAGTSVIEVTPAKGYKVNLEFPSRLKLSPVQGIAHTKAELGKDDAEVTEKVLRFNVGFTPSAAGKYALEGVADFSVCNDRTCRLIRGEKLTWEVAVQ
ncbi:MAG: hypothetical protein ACE366_06085 [Bradymonadia bacterium]